MAKNWIKRLLGKNAPGSPIPQRPSDALAKVTWVDAGANPWGVPVLDVRPVTLSMVSTSKDVRCATNAVSYSGDDGTSFIGIDPQITRYTPASLQFRIDRYFADGALFIPRVMEHKWAIYLHRRRVIFIRSWLRQVMATAGIEVAANTATIAQISGVFTAEDEEPSLTVRVADYLIRSHALGEIYPAPLPAGMDADPSKAALWCFSCFGNLATVATPHSVNRQVPQDPLRTQSLLHIAIARGDTAAAKAQIDAGVPVDLIAGDGLAPLHWCVVQSNTALADLLLNRGSSVDVRSTEGATPLMNAVQSKRVEWVNYFLHHGADPNAADLRGFTPLHRAAEMGLPEIARRLLEVGAWRDVAAQGHTPLSLAQARGEKAVVEILTDTGRET